MTSTYRRAAALLLSFLLFVSLVPVSVLGDEGLLESRRGLGFFVRPGAREQLRQAERARFMDAEWPALRARLRRLGVSASDLNWE